MNARRPPARVLWTFRAVTVLLVTLVLAVAGEVGLRLAWGGFYLSPPSGVRTRPSRTRIWENRPGVRFEYGEPEFHHAVSHDSHGFRGPEVDPRPARSLQPEGFGEGFPLPGRSRSRVIALGDSFLWGVGAEDGETIPARLSALDPSLEVVNTGVIGYGTQHELLLLRDQGFALEPRAVVLFFFWNDLEDVLHAGLAGFSLDAAGALVHTPTHVAAPLPDAGPRPPGLADRSYLVRFASDAWKNLRFRISLAAGESARKPGVMDPADQERAWALVRALLAAMRDDCRARGVALLLVAIPDQAQVHPEWPVIGLGEHIPGVPARLVSLAASLDIPALDLTPALVKARESETRPLYYRRDRHFTPAGYDAAARAVLPRLKALLEGK